MPRLINLTDDKRRDAQVALQSPPSRDDWHYVGPTDQPVKNERFIKATDAQSYDGLMRRYNTPEALAQALVEGDPELDLELVGRKVGPVDRVWVRPDGSVLYSARVLLVVTDPSGQEKSRADFVAVEATVSEETPLPWTGRLVPIEDVVRRFALMRKLQLRHINGLTYDFLFEIARTLETQGKMLFVGSGPKGAQPLIFHTNGTPYRGFLEGRTKDGGFRLVLHLSNLELKAPPKIEPAAPAAAGGSAP